MKKQIRSILFTWSVLVILAFWISTPVYAQAPKKVLLMPFTLYSGEDLSYLQKGIGQMLASRLTRPEAVEVMQASAQVSKSQDPVKQAKKLGADYLISGSITMLGGSVSTDAKVIELQENKQVMAFSRVGKDQSAIIDHVDQLATQMNTQLFGVAPARQATPAPAAQAPTPTIYQHPEKLMAQSEQVERPPVSGNFSTDQAALVMRGRRVSFLMRGVTSGDVDGDGKSDVICIGPTKVVLYGVAQKQFIKKAEVKARGGHYISVDAVDVNGNGKAEIFVTNFYNSDSRVTSFVLEWDGQRLVRIANNLRWYFRALTVPGRGVVLAGQRQGVSEPFGSTIHEMAWRGGEYQAADRLPLPSGLNLYGFAYGNIRTPHDTEVVAYNPDGFVRILNPRGGEEWISGDNYGVSHSFIEFPDESDQSNREYVYLSPRIRLYDLDGDGLQEVFVLDNEDISGAFARVRLFKNGRLVGLKWDEVDMIPVWKTRSLTKYISDFVFTDVDGDGAPEVVASVVQKSSGILSKGNSYLVAFALAKPRPKPGQ